MFSIHGILRNFLTSVKTVGCSSTGSTSNKIFQETRILKTVPWFHTSVVLDKESKSKNDEYQRNINYANRSSRKRQSQYMPKQNHQYVWIDEENVFFKLHSAGQKLLFKRNSILKNFSAASLVNYAPSSTKPYLQLIRADKPIGTLLLYFPCAFSICLAAPFGTLPSLYYLGMWFLI